MTDTASHTEVFEDVARGVSEELSRLDKIINATFKDGLWAFIITAAIILFLAISITKLLTKVLKQRNVNVFAVRIVKIIMYTFASLAIAMQIVPLEQFAISLLAGGSLAVVVVGFAAQEAMANIVSGMFIAMFKPFTPGDLIKINSQNIVGTVEDISLRHTVIKTFENSRIIVPNSVINSSTIENIHYTDLRHCNFLDIGIGYDADIDLAKKIITDEIMHHKFFLDIRTDDEKAAGAPCVIIRCTGLRDFSVDLRAVIWSKDYTAGIEMLSDLRQSIKLHFDRDGIEIPFPYRNIIIKETPDAIRHD